MHRSPLHLLVVALLAFCLPTPPAHGRSTAPWRAAAGDGRMLLDARDGRLDEFSLLDATLLANGVHDLALQQQLRATLDEHVQQLREELQSTPDALQRAKLILARMHERILRGTYQSDCTQISRALRDGDFNCVSATLLYIVLCRELNLDAVSIATPTHVFCRVQTGDRWLDVQTTCANWFELTPQQQRQHTPGTHDSTDQTEIREITDVQLIAKVYYNRGVRHLRAARFREAEEDFQHALELDADDASADDNLLATWNNWALAEAAGGRYAVAAELVRRGLERNPHYAPLRANDLHIHQQWALQLCQEHRFQWAVELLEQGRIRQPEQPLFITGPLAVLRLWAVAQANEGDFAGVLHTCRAAQQSAAACGREVAADQWLAEVILQLDAEGQAETARELLRYSQSDLPASVTLAELEARLTHSGS